MDALIIILIILISLYLIGNFVFNMMFNPRARRPDINKRGKKEGADMKGGFPKAWLEENENKEDIYIESHDGLRLHAACVREKDRHCWVIILHGYTSDCEHYAAYAEHYFNQGFNTLLPDARAHGKSQGQYIGMGWPDRLDLLQWCEYILEKDREAQIIIHGMSMGATTALLASGEKLPKEVRAIISDSAYASTGEVMKHQLKAIFHLPAFPLLNLADIVCRMKCGYSILKDGDAARAINHTQIPMLFIHGRKDNFVPMTLHEKLYTACSAPKERLLTDEGHIMGRFMQEELYWQTVHGFLEKYLPQ